MIIQLQAVDNRFINTLIILVTVGSSLVIAFIISWKLTASSIPLVLAVVILIILTRNSSRNHHKKGVKLLEEAAKVLWSWHFVFIAFQNDRSLKQ